MCDRFLNCCKTEWLLRCRPNLPCAVKAALRLQIGSLFRENAGYSNMRRKLLLAAAALLVFASACSKPERSRETNPNALSRQELVFTAAGEESTPPPAPDDSTLPPSAQEIQMTPAGEESIASQPGETAENAALPETGETTAENAALPGFRETTAGNAEVPGFLETAAENAEAPEMWETTAAGQDPASPQVVEVFEISGNARPWLDGLMSDPYSERTAAPVDGVCSSADEIAAFLRSCRINGRAEFTVTCPAELFWELQRDDFSKLRKIQLLCGVTPGKLNYRTGELIYSETEYDSAPAVICESWSEAESAVAEIIEQGNRSCRLVCSPELYERLFTGGDIFALMSRCGIEDCSVSGYNDQSVCVVRDFIPVTAAFACAKDIDELSAAFAAFRQKNEAQLYLSLDKSLFERMSADDFFEFKTFLVLSGVDYRRIEWNVQKRTIGLTEVSYTETGRTLCEKKEDIVRTIRAMGAAGETAFDLVLTPELYSEVCSGEDWELARLQVQAGMTTSGYTYSESSRLIMYRDAQIVADAKQLLSLEEAFAFAKDCARQAYPSFCLFCSPQVYRAITEGSDFPQDSGLPYSGDLYAACGILHANTSFFEKTGLITIQNIDYYAGEKIYTAVLRGVEGELSGREQAALAQAYAIAQRAAAAADADPRSLNDPRMKTILTARNIHDSICERVVYTIDDTTDDDDMAIGALVDGRANCDGYADAFCLTARLAGLNVSLQYGDTYSGREEGTHMWNLLQVGSDWTLVDVTWDDPADENGAQGRISYKWFCVGSDRADRSHIWNRSLSQTLAAETDMSLRPEKEYLMGKDWTEASAAEDIVAEGRHWAELYYPVSQYPGGEPYREVFTALHSAGVGNIIYAWNEELGCLSLRELEY